MLTHFVPTISLCFFWVEIFLLSSDVAELLSYGFQEDQAASVRPPWKTYMVVGANIYFEWISCENTITNFTGLLQEREANTE